MEEVVTKDVMVERKEKTLKKESIERNNKK